VPGRLIVDDADPAIGAGAEPILCGCVGVSARIGNWRGSRLDNTNVQSLAVRLAQNLVQGAVIGRIQRARSAMCGGTGVTGRSVDVAGALRPGRRYTTSRGSLLRHRQGGANRRKHKWEHNSAIDSRFHSYPVRCKEFSWAFRRDGLFLGFAAQISRILCREYVYHRTLSFGLILVPHYLLIHCLRLSHRSVGQVDWISKQKPTCHC
jgi:hypothetical protein